MKILFVFPSSYGGYGINEATEQPPLGIGYLASIAQRAGYKAGVLDSNFLKHTPGQAVEAIKQKKPDIVCLSLAAFNFRSGLKIAGLLKKTIPGVCVIAGGAHPSALMEKTLDKTTSIDAVVFGEGESTFLEIVKRMGKGVKDFSGIDGVIYRDGPAIVKNKAREPIMDLDTLPFPAFHLYPELSGYHRRALRLPAAPILTSRGCPFECVFCSRAVFGRRVRYRSAENVVSEIDYLVERFGIRQLDIVDDNFITYKQRAVRILELLCDKAYRLSINLQSGVSARLVDKEIIGLMKKAGVYRIAFGVESGNRRVREIIKKNEDLGVVEKSIQLAKKAGIRADTFFMIGLPGDTPLSMEDTINFAKKTDPHTANFHMVVPFPGTELHSMIKQNGKFLRNTDGGIKSGYNYPEAFYELGSLKKKDIEKYYKKAYRNFYFRPKKILQTLFSIRSFEELKWLFRTGFLVVFSLFRKRDG